jgi:hypothetical protein
MEVEQKVLVVLEINSHVLSIEMQEGGAKSKWIHTKNRQRFRQVSANEWQRGSCLKGVPAPLYD